MGGKYSVVGSNKVDFSSLLNWPLREQSKRTSALPLSTKRWNFTVSPAAALQKARRLAWRTSEEGKHEGEGRERRGGGERRMKGGLQLQLSQQQQLLHDSSHMCSHEWLRPELRWTHWLEPRRSTMSSAHSYAGDTREY